MPRKKGSKSVKRKKYVPIPAPILPKAKTLMKKKKVVKSTKKKRTVGKRILDIGKDIKKARKKTY